MEEQPNSLGASWFSFIWPFATWAAGKGVVTAVELTRFQDEHGETVQLPEVPMPLHGHEHKSHRERPQRLYEVLLTNCKEQSLKLRLCYLQSG